jgi:hypothetical protein
MPEAPRNVEDQMSPRYRIGTIAAFTLLGTGLTLALGAQSAQAAIDPTNCTLHASLPNYIATCTDYTPGGGSPWHLELTCERANGKIFYGDGTNAYGTSYSQATCGTADVVSYAIVNI